MPSGSTYSFAAGTTSITTPRSWRQAGGSGSRYPSSAWRIWTTPIRTWGTSVVFTGSRSSSVSSLAVCGSAASASTRSRTGARRSFWAFVALVAAVVGARAADAATAQTPLPWRVGGRVAFTVDAAGFPDSSGYSLDVYIRLTPATLANLTDDFQGAGHLNLAV